MLEILVCLRIYFYFGSVRASARAGKHALTILIYIAATRTHRHTDGQTDSLADSKHQTFAVSFSFSSSRSPAVFWHNLRHALAGAPCTKSMIDCFAVEFPASWTFAQNTHIHMHTDTHTHMDTFVWAAKARHMSTPKIPQNFTLVLATPTGSCWPSWKRFNSIFFILLNSLLLLSGF